MAQPPIVVLMGVAGAGKTTIGRHLAAVWGCPFYEGDDFHPPQNLAKMAQGIPLDDCDRTPWLHAIRALIADLSQQHQGAVIACSALKQTYRDQLQQDDAWGAVQFIYLQASASVLRQRLLQRPNHFMPANLLESQIATLEEPHTALQVNANQPVDQVLHAILQGISA